MKIPIPANDNPIPRNPANDNKPGRIPLPSAKNAAGAIFRTGIGIGLRALFWGGFLYTLYDEFYSPEDGYPFYHPGGYTPRFMPPCNNGTEPRGWQSGVVNSCLAGQATNFETGFLTNVYQNPKPLGLIMVAYQSCPGQPGGPYTYQQCLALDPSGASDRGYRNWSMNRVDASAGLIPHARAAEWHIPATHPNIDPLDLPIAQRVPLQRPLNWPYAEPGYKIHERLNGWQKPNPFARPRPRPGARPRISPHPLQPPVKNPAQTPFLPNPGSRLQVVPKPQVLPGKHRNRVPPPGTKERKFILAPLQGSAVGIAMNAVTEANDFIEALYWSIPSNLRKPAYSIQSRLAEVYRHFDKIDIETAINNLLKAQLADAIGGMSGKLNAKANRAGNFATGLRRPNFF